MTGITQARVFIGGRRDGFQGAMPGLLEEAILAIEQGQPIYLAGGFGGLTLEIAIALGLGERDWFPTQQGLSNADQGLPERLGRLREIVKSNKAQSLANGLTEQQNRQLAACHRPSEIAALISLGLGKRFRRS